MDKANARRGTEPTMDALQALRAERSRALTLRQVLHDDFDSIVEASASSNADDEHDPEGATVAFERAQVLALLAQSRTRLDEIDRAIQRCEQGGYGICESCGEAIPAERLVARPSARSCLRCLL